MNGRLFKFINYFFALTCLITSSCVNIREDEVSKKRFFWPPYKEKAIVEFITILPKPESNKEKKILDYFLSKETNNYLLTPFDIELDNEGNIYISDRGLNRIVIIDSKLNDVKTLKTEVTIKPFGLTINESKIYVVNGNNKIYVFNKNGKLVNCFGGEKYFERAAFIAFNKRLKRFYVSDARAHKIVVFDENGNHLFSFGGPGIEAGEFASPQGIDIDRSGNLYVADVLNSRVQIFDSNGKFIQKFGSNCLQDYCLSKPKAIAVTNEKTVYVTDQQSGQLKAYTKDGEFLFVVGSIGGREHLLDFSSPTGIVASPNGRIFVADQINRRISIWQELTENYLSKNPLTTQDILAFDEISKRYLIQSPRKQL